MRNQLAVVTIFLAGAAVFYLPVSAQNPSSQQAGATGDQKKAPTAVPALRHNISGTWSPTPEAQARQNRGVTVTPDLVPFTPYGLQVYKSHRPTAGPDGVVPELSNDPRDKCEPPGLPRADLYQLRETQILQDEYKIALLYQYTTRWRVIWTDGRELPKLIEGGVTMGEQAKEPRYYGYSVGKWVDDTTLVVDTVGMIGDGRMWLDNGGLPVSDQLHVTETFHRVDHDNLELSVTIDDPKMYSKPWVAMDKFPMKLEDPHTDVIEHYCSLTEMEQYNKLFGYPQK
jgi:hypothetical protein